MLRLEEKHTKSLQSEGFLNPGLWGVDKKATESWLVEEKGEGGASSWELSHHYLEAPVSSLVHGSAPALFSRRAHPLTHTFEC